MEWSWDPEPSTTATFSSRAAVTNSIQPEPHLLSPPRVMVERWAGEERALALGFQAFPFLCFRDGGSPRRRGGLISRDHHDGPALKVPFHDGRNHPAVRLVQRRRPRGLRLFSPAAMRVPLVRLHGVDARLLRHAVRLPRRKHRHRRAGPRHRVLTGAAHEVYLPYVRRHGVCRLDGVVEVVLRFAVEVELFLGNGKGSDSEGIGVGSSGGRGTVGREGSGGVGELTATSGWLYASLLPMTKIVTPLPGGS